METLPELRKLWNYNDPAGTELKFRDLLPQAESSGDTEYLAQLLTQIARSLALQNKFDDAHATLDRVLQMLSKQEPSVANIRYFLERGRTFNSSGKRVEAMPFFQSSHDAAIAQNQIPFAIDALHMLAIAESDPRKQVEWNLKAFELVESTPVEDTASRGWLEPLCNNIGESYLLLKEYDTAYSYFQRMAEMQTARTGEVDMYTLKDQAKALRLGGHAEESYNIILPVFEKLSSEQNDDGYIRQELAESLYALGKTDEAKPHFLRSYELLSADSWVLQNEAASLERMKKLSQ